MTSEPPGPVDPGEGIPLIADPIPALTAEPTIAPANPPEPFANTLGEPIIMRPKSALSYFLATGLPCANTFGEEPETTAKCPTQHTVGGQGTSMVCGRHGSPGLSIALPFANTVCCVALTGMTRVQACPV